MITKSSKHQTVRKVTKEKVRDIFDSFKKSQEAYFDPIIGEKNRLKVGELINNGAFGAVFRLEGGNIPLVLKIVNPEIVREIDPKEKQPVRFDSIEKSCEYFRFERDAMIECKDCKNIMPLYGYYENIDNENEEATFAYIMPELNSIYDYLNRDNEHEIRYINVLKQICVALQCCEDHNILHRDVKKENIFYYKDDNTNKYVFVLGDFGIARRGTQGRKSGAGVTQIGSYTIAPEIMRCRDLEGRYNSDLYSLGMALTCVVKNGDVVDVDLKISQELKTILIKMKEDDPAKRYQHACEVVEELNKLQNTHIKSRSDVLNKIKRIDADVEMCKNTFFNGNIDKALALAKAGHEIGNNPCTRIYAYILCYKYHNVDENANNIITARQLLEDLKDYDITAKFLYAYISYIGKEAISNEDDEDIKRQAIKYFRETADAGCPIAQYYYGKMLYMGGRHVRQNKNLAAEYLIESSNGHFEPALYYIQDIMNNDPEMRKLFALAGVNSIEIGELSSNCVSRSFVNFL